MTVLVVHEVSDNVSPAKAFGEIRYVNQYYIHADELVRDGNDNLIPVGYRVNMERVVSAFDPDRDFLLIAGDHLQLLALTALLIGRYGYLTVLRWDRKISEYIPVRLSSGIVPPAQPVLVSGTHIGETDGESRIEDKTRREAWNAFATLATESPLTRRDPRKRPAQDDH